MYLIVNAKQNLHNDICALLGLMGVFAMGLAYRGGKDEGWSYDDWLLLGRWVGLGCGSGSGLGGAVYVWCWDSIGKAVDVQTQRYSTIPTQSPYNTKSSPPTAYARLARPPFHHLAQTHTHHTYPTSIPTNSTP